MPKLIALWSNPSDAAAFDADYEQSHAVLAAKIPGVSFEGMKVLQGDVHRVAILTWDSMESFQSAFSTPEMAAVMEDGNRLQSEFGAKLDTLVTE